MQNALRVGHWPWTAATASGRCAVRNEWTERIDAAIPLGSGVRRRLGYPECAARLAANCWHLCRDGSAHHFRAIPKTRLARDTALISAARDPYQRRAVLALQPFDKKFTNSQPVPVTRLTTVQIISPPDVTPSASKRKNFTPVQNSGISPQLLVRQPLNIAPPRSIVRFCRQPFCATRSNAILARKPLVVGPISWPPLHFAATFRGPVVCAKRPPGAQFAPHAPPTVAVAPPLPPEQGLHTGQISADYLVAGLRFKAAQASSGVVEEVTPSVMIVAPRRR